MTPDSTVTDAKFFIILGKEKIVSDKGILKIDSIKYKRYLDSSYVISFADPIVVSKLYKVFLPSEEPTKLGDLCGRVFYLKHR